MATVDTAPAPGSVEAIRRVLVYLSEERHHLYARAAEPAELEANRKAIAAMQSQLLDALGRGAASER